MKKRFFQPVNLIHRRSSKIEEIKTKLRTLSTIRELEIRNFSLHSLGALEHIDNLYASHSSIETFGKLSSAEKISLFHISSLKEITELKTVEYLYMIDCLDIKTIKNIQKCSILEIKNCDDLRTIENIEYINILYLKTLIKFQEINNIKKIQLPNSFDFANHSKNILGVTFSDLPIFQSFGNLQVIETTLSIWNLPKLESLNEIEEIKGNLFISNCPRLIDLSSLKFVNGSIVFYDINDYNNTKKSLRKSLHRKVLIR